MDAYGPCAKTLSSVFDFALQGIVADSLQILRLGFRDLVDARVL